MTLAFLGVGSGQWLFSEIGSKVMGLNKNKILVFVDWYLPAFKAGGPIRSVYNLVSRMSNEFDFYIITGDRDLGDVSPFENVALNKWLKHEEAQVIYLSKEHQNRTYFSELIKEVAPQKIYINSLFSFSFALLPLSLKKKFSAIHFILAPRGMLGGGALEIKKNKKKLFIHLSKVLSFYKGVTWHATNELEKNDISRSFGDRCKIEIADNLPSGQSLSFNELKIEKKKNFDVKRFLFISRISRKKNVDLLIDYFKKIPSLTDRYELDIIGTIEDGVYFEELKEKAKGHKSIRLQNALSPNELMKYYSEAHFFALPTKHENYGHVIIEALSYACPVIISDQTPWRELEEKNVGWDLSLEQLDSFISVIKRCIEMDEETYFKMAESAYDFANVQINKEDVLNAYRNLLS